MTLNGFGKSAAWSAAIFTVLALGGCKDSGLPGKNRPLNEAMQSEWRYPAYEQVAGADSVMSLAGHRWQITGEKQTIPSRLLAPVATVNGAEIFSLKSDVAPYDRLYSATTDGKYSVIANID
ncbi:MAG: hypothetical protein ABIV28_06310 [Longimicrobiales bacterium]